jgi:hypothetical protein
MKLTKKEKNAFRKVGAEGGKKAASGMTPEQRKARATKAAQARWKREEKHA